MTSDEVKDRYQRDIMGRKECSPIMPCGVCRVFNKALKVYPKGCFADMGRVIDI